MFNTKNIFTSWCSTSCCGKFSEICTTSNHKVLSMFMCKLYMKMLKYHCLLLTIIKSSMYMIG